MKSFSLKTLISALSLFAVLAIFIPDVNARPSLHPDDPCNAYGRNGKTKDDCHKNNGTLKCSWYGGSPYCRSSN